MPYQVLIDEVSVLKALSENLDASGNVIGYDHVSRTWLKDQVIPDEEVSPVIRKLVEDGDASMAARLKYVELKKTEEVATSATQDIVPVPVESAAPGASGVAEAAAGVPDPPEADITSQQFEDPTPGRVRIDEAAAAEPAAPEAQAESTSKKGKSAKDDSEE
jgi:hypothetical protein